MKKLLSFHGKVAIKKKYLARLQTHAKLDEIIKGTYWSEGKGCAVGCTLNAGPKDVLYGSIHKLYESELGIPEWLALLEDRIFEGLPNGEAKSFPIEFLKSIPVGVDLSLVKHKFLYWLLVDEKDGVIKYADTYAVREVISDVGHLHRNIIRGKRVTSAAWAAARAAAGDAARAARDAARAAVWAAGDAAGDAAGAAARAARDAARDAVWAAARAAVWAAGAAAGAARDAAYKKMAAKLLSLLKNVKRSK